MADPEQYKSVSLDLDTYNLLKTVAEAECRSIGLQIRWMIKNGMVNPTSPNVSPSALIPAQQSIPTMTSVKRRKGNKKLFTSGATCEILLRLFSTNATLTASDFVDADLEDPSGALYNLFKRGDVQRLGEGKPYRYHITVQGVAKAREILRRREREDAA